VLELDGRVEEVLKQRFTALVHVCLTSANVLKNVEAAMLEAAGAWAAEQLPATSAADLFFEQHPDAAEAEEEVAGFYDEAAPERGPGRAPGASPPVAELCVLATPPGPAGDRFRELAQRAVPDAELHHVVSPDDVVLYRERNNLPLSDLEQLG